MPTAYSYGELKLETPIFLELTHRRLDSVEKRMRIVSVDDHHPELVSALEHLLSAGGKRIRPRLVLLAADIAHADEDSAVTFAAAIEMLHTATLVHDDLIDGSLLRRGNPTINANWTAGATVLTGDYIFARAANLASHTGSLSLLKRFSSCLMTIVNGEVTQLFSRDRNITFEDYKQRIYAKTAALFELSMEGAALLPGSDPSLRDPLKQFGYNLGIAFQIMDDILDFTGNPDELGKPVASDIQQGLITLPTLLFLEAPGGNPELQSRIQSNDLSDEEYHQLVAAICDSDAIDKARKVANTFLNSAEDSLNAFPEGPAREALFSITQSMRERRY
ncbi:MAG: polyprenyl synthetase family protein [Anaerolineales bacterium]|nr:polyprenyl synthetase family protein [Anaerolineales bacterium]